MRHHLSFQALPYHHYLGTLIVAISLITSSHAATYTIEPTHANVRFAIDHFNTSTNTGGFYNLNGQVEFDPQAKTGSVFIAIPMDSLNTGNRAFDETLKSKDFFDVERYPLAYFVSTQWHFSADDKLSKVTRVDGNLTLHGKANPVTLTATKFNCYFSPIAKGRVCGGDFTTTINRTQWGISKYVLLGMSKEVTLNIQVEAIKQ